MRKGVVVNNVRKNTGWLPNPLLPDTKSELAVPLLVGDQLLGVLDVQASEVDHFSEDDIQTHTVLASQVAIALQNADSFEETKRVLAGVG
jgi:GAF domain-containing protein